MKKHSSTKEEAKTRREVRYTQEHESMVSTHEGTEGELYAWTVSGSRNSLGKGGKRQTMTDQAALGQTEPAGEAQGSRTS